MATSTTTRPAPLAQGRSDSTDILLQALRQDAFLLEYTTLGQAGSPEWHEGKLPDAHEFGLYFTCLIDRLDAWFGHEFFCLSVNEIHCPHPTHSQVITVFAFPPGEDIPGYEPVQDCGITFEQVYNWHISSPSFSEAYNRWKQRNPAARVILAPYIVHKTEKLPPIDYSEMAALFDYYRSLTDDQRFAFHYTTPSMTSEHRPTLEPGCYQAALVVGIPEKIREATPALAKVIQALSIEFQLSWGYPLLAKKRASQAQRERELAVKESEHTQKARAQDREFQKSTRLKSQVLMLEQQIRLIKDDLLLPPERLVQAYKEVSQYIPNDGEIVRYFDKWDFRHSWNNEKLISAEEEAFKAQFACLILKRVKDDLPGRYGSWNFAAPWELLRYFQLKEFIFSSAFEATLRRVKSVTNVAWSHDDVLSFAILKNCFWHSCKGYLTPALLLHWAMSLPTALEVNWGDDKVPHEYLAYSNSAYRGTWPKLELLPALHGICEDIRPEAVSITRTKGAKHEILRIGFTPVRKECLEFVEAQQKKPIPQEVPTTGLLEHYIDYVRKHGKFERAQDTLVVRFTTG